MTQISGTLIGADSRPLSGVTITFSSLATSSVLSSIRSSISTDKLGQYAINVPVGYYAVQLSTNGLSSNHIGNIRVYEDSQPADLNAFLGAPESEPMPEWLQKFEAALREIAVSKNEAVQASIQASESAKQSASAQAATESIKQDVLTMRDDVRQNTDKTESAASEAAENAEKLAGMATELIRTQKLIATLHPMF